MEGKKISPKKLEKTILAKYAYLQQFFNCSVYEANISIPIIAKQ